MKPWFVAFMVLATASPAWAWGSHRLITHHALAEVKWLDRCSDLSVTPYRYEDKEPFNPNFELRYLEPLEKTSAREILVLYSSEPDWSLDKVFVSPFQILMGGGHGCRHQRYFLGPWRFGDAPHRVAHFNELSKQAFRRGDPYWGFRFFARSLHYLEDLGQPLHNQPLTFGQIRRCWFYPPWIVRYSLNLHSGYEYYVGRHMQRQDPSGKRFIRALRSPEAVSVKEIEEASIALSEEAHGKAWPLLQASEEFWPSRVRSKFRRVRPTEAEVFPPSSRGQTKLDALTEERLKELGKVMRGALAALRRDVLEDSLRNRARNR